MFARTDRLVVGSCLLLFLGGSWTVAEEAGHPLSEERQAEIKKSLDDQLGRLNAKLKNDPADVQAVSARGAVYFHLGKFTESVADFDRMIELDPKTRASHWRRGISLYYAGEFKKSAKQFELYHTFDNVDRENGIWRFLAQARAFGFEKARAGLLKYEKTDRAPFPDVYAMFAGKLTGGQIVERIKSAKISTTERDKRLFYAHLYVGLYAEAQQKPDMTAQHIRMAVANPWGQEAGGGPGYMWHVARVHFQNLKRKPAAE